MIPLDLDNPGGSHANRSHPTDPLQSDFNNFQTNQLPMATITKRDLVIRISNETGLTQQEVFNVLQSFIEEVTTSLATNDDVVLRNFGAFQVTKTKPKIGRNPNKPEAAVPIPARAVVKFKPGKELKERVAKVLPELG
jgi:nucleoid DNA-binding protein